MAAGLFRPLVEAGTVQGARDKWVPVSWGPEAWAGAPASQPGSLGPFCHHLWPLKWKGNRLHGRDTDMEAQVHMAPNHEMPLLKPHGPAQAPASSRVTSKVLTLAYRIRPAPPRHSVISLASSPLLEAFAVSVPLPESAVPYTSASLLTSLHSSPLSRIPPQRGLCWDPS